MKKYVLLVFLISIFYFPSFPQTRNIEPIRRELDSLRNILPTLRDSARIDCLIMMADKYNYLPMGSLQNQIDSSWPLARQSNIEARKLGYKKGIAYSLLRMGECEDTKDDMWFDGKNGNDPAIKAAYDACVKDFKEAIAIANEIREYPALGYAYKILAWLAEKRDENPAYYNYMMKSIENYEKAGNQKPSATYREHGYVDRPGCAGNEEWLGYQYMNLGRASVPTKYNLDTISSYFNKATYYFQKSAAKDELANNYFWQRKFQSGIRDIEGAVASTKKIISICQELGKQEDVLREYNWLCDHYLVRGNFEVGIEYARQSIQLAEEQAKRVPIDSVAGWFKSARAQAFLSMGQLYKVAGDYIAALELLHKAKAYYVADTSKIDNNDRWYLDAWRAAIGDAHRLMGNHDSALYYLHPFITMPTRHFVVVGLTQLMNLYVDMKQYDKAISMLNGEVEGKKLELPKNGYALTLAGAAYFGKKEFQDALSSAREGLIFLRYNENRIKMIDNYSLLSDIFHVLGKNDSAYYYQKQYSLLKDSLLNRQFYFRLNGYKKEAEEQRKTSQINLLNKDNQIKQQKLKQQSLVKNGLIIGIVLLSLLGVFIFRNLSLKRKNDKLRLLTDLETQQLASEKKHAELQQQALELEMQALRAQMNPHFIFNCLSSINRFIFKNDNKLASDYLTRFSRLIRMVLMNSQKKLIPLEDELEMLKLYLDLERLRFKDAFDYSITTTNIVDDGAIFIPPLLLQPFCENAVWHGLMHKENKGHLNIIISEVISENEKVLLCIIEDDGVGREKAAELKSKSAENEKSLGLKITTERLALLNQEINFSSFYRIEDIRNENNEVTGTRVQLKIRYKEIVEELA